MELTQPQKQYANAVVLYHWNKCGHCVRFMPEWTRAKSQFLTKGVNVGEFEVEQNAARLRQHGVNLNEGVPRVLMYDAQGHERLYTGERTASALLAGFFAPQLKTVDPNHIPIPSVVLFYRDTCRFCTEFKPTYIQFANSMMNNNNNNDKHIEVVGVDTVAHPTALSMLLPEAASKSVPHVVYFGTDGRQIPFGRNRTVEDLHAFVNEQTTHKKHVRFHGGSNDETVAQLGDVFEQLEEVWQDELSENENDRHIFAPHQAIVLYVGKKRGDTPRDDKVCIVLRPNEHSDVFAVIYSSKYHHNKLRGKFAFDKDVFAYVRNKRYAKFRTITSRDDPLIHTLLELGYYIHNVE